MEPFRLYIDVVIVRTNQDKFDAETRRQLIGIMSDTVLYRDGNYKLSSVIGYYVRDCLEALERRMDVSEIRCYEL